MIQSLILIVSENFGFRIIAVLYFWHRSWKSQTS